LPVVVITQPAPEPEQVAVPVPVPYPVIAGIINPPPRKPAQKQPQPERSTTTAAKPSPPASTPVTPPATHPRKRLRDRGEGEIYNRVLSESNDPARQLVDLDNWTRRYRESDFDDQRSVLYIRAYSATGHPDKVVEIGSRLMDRGLKSIFDDPAEVLTVLYLTTLSNELLTRPSQDQRRAIRAASHDLLEFTPQFFASDRRPQGVNEDDWKNARVYMDNAARRALATSRN
jgi:hypothetical protein